MGRYICKCGLRYRDEDDLRQHKHFGCKAGSGAGETWSKRDAEEGPQGEEPQGEEPKQEEGGE
jgi:hypothetical protein